MKTNWPTFRFGCLLLAGAALTAFAVRAQVARDATLSQPAPAASISDIAVSHAGQQTTVRISGTGELRYQTSRLDGPPRLVLDFANTRLAVSASKVPSQYVPVRDVRAGQSNPGQSRVVIDLAELVPFTVQEDGSSLTVCFTVPASATAPGAPRAAITKTAQDKPVMAAIPLMPLPSWLTGSDAAFASPAGEPPVPQAQNAPTAAPPARADPAPAPAKAKYTGEPISVNLKDVDLKDFFRLIHEISGLNVVLDPSVKGTVTLVLDNVPWDQGLEIVLRNNGLSDEIDGNVLRIATQDTVKHEVDQRRDLAKAQSDAIETVTFTRVLSYAKADTTMVTLLKRFLSPRGDAYGDARTNTLIIRDVPSSIPLIDNLLRQLDRKSQQVEIDARVVQASRSFAREIGTQFGFSTPTGSAGNTAIGGLVGASGFASPIIHSIAAPFSTASGTGNSIPLNTNLGASAPTSGFTISNQGHNYAIDFMLSMMESKGVGKVLSEPKGVTQNNEKLTVKQGTQVPIQTTINNTISVQYVDALLKMEVTPQITAEGTVFLVISVENTQIDQGIPLIQGTPALDTQSTETKVLINDGGTVVIGGVVVNQQNTSIDQVPLLGSVPIIGNLFKHTTINVSSQELLFFVTPRILPS